MIKLVAHDKKQGRSVMILGIDAENVKRLKQGYHIRFTADHLGFNGEIIIHYEETMELLEARLAPLIGPHTRVSDRR
jgi:hypothetical protein